MTFEDRRGAGRLLAEELRSHAGGGAVVLGVTHGGAVVGHEIALTLGLPFDVLVVHRVEEPGGAHIGAVAEPHHVVVSSGRYVASLDPAWVERAVAHSVNEARRRGPLYRGARPQVSLAGRTVIVAAESAGTGLTVRAAVKAARAAGAREVVVALPVAPPGVVRALDAEADRVVCLATPGQLIWGEIHYPSRGDVSDDDIRQLLAPDTHAQDTP